MIKEKCSVCASIIGADEGRYNTIGNYCPKCSEQASWNVHQRTKEQSEINQLLVHNDWTANLPPTLTI